MSGRQSKSCQTLQKRSTTALADDNLRISFSLDGILLGSSLKSVDNNARTVLLDVLVQFSHYVLDLIASLVSPFLTCSIKFRIVMSFLCSNERDYLLRMGLKATLTNSSLSLSLSFLFSLSVSLALFFLFLVISLALFLLPFSS